jgi:hypothetical protein
MAYCGLYCIGLAGWAIVGLLHCLIIYIEKEIMIEFTPATLIDDFNGMKTRRVKLK